MNAALFLVVALAAQTGLERVREMLAAGDYHSSWEALGGESDELTRSRMRAEILYRAGDPAGAMRAARDGLEIDAAQIELLYHAAAAAIWLEDGADAVAYSDRFVHAARAEKGHEEQSTWLEAARGLAARSEALVARQVELSRTLTRFRVVSVGGMALWLAALWLALRTQGKSSRPVS